MATRKLNDLVIEWDNDKAIINYYRHKLSFETACYIFNDPNRIEMYDEKHSESEDRYQTIGMVGDVLFVVYTERGSRIRMISARYASKREEELYFGSC